MMTETEKCVKRGERDGEFSDADHREQEEAESQSVCFTPDQMLAVMHFYCVPNSKESQERDVIARKLSPSLSLCLSCYSFINTNVVVVVVVVVH